MTSARITVCALTYTKRMKIVFCGGGTAGHVTPNLALADKLSDHELYYIGTDGMEKGLVAPYVDSGKIKEYYSISANKLRRKLTLKNLLLPFQLLKSVKEAKKHLRKIRPDVVFSKGGYAGLPVIIAAKKLKIPSIIHESDMSLGLANRICKRYADVFLAAFNCDEKAKVSGLIIRDEIMNGSRGKGLATMSFNGAKPILLVMGGSLGAQSLNEAIRLNKQLADKFDIFVSTGKGKRIDCDFVHQAEYVSNIADVFAATDVCVTRAGSTSLAELTLATVPFVTVPLTKCSRGEQVNNAKWFAERGCGIAVTEDDQLAAKLESAVNAAYDNRQPIQTKQLKQRETLYGTDNVVNEILSLIKK